MYSNLPDQAPLYPKPFPWKFLLLSVIILLLLSVSTNAYLYLSLQKQKTAPPTSNLSLPFSISDPVISMIGIAYQLKGRIHQITSKGTEYEIILQGADGKLYPNQPLRFSQNTLLTKTNSASSSAINILPKVNDLILLNYYYDPLKKTGYVTKVEVAK